MNIFGFASIQFCFCSSKVAIDNTQIKGHGNVPTKLFIKANNGLHLPHLPNPALYTFLSLIFIISLHIFPVDYCFKVWKWTLWIKLGSACFRGEKNHRNLSLGNGNFFYCWRMFHVWASYCPPSIHISLHICTVVYGRFKAP